MKFYEHTIVAKQDLSAKDLELLKISMKALLTILTGRF